jgi:hypothetical protein
VNPTRSQVLFEDLPLTVATLDNVSYLRNCQVKVCEPQLDQEGVRKRMVSPLQIVGESIGPPLSQLIKYVPGGFPLESGGACWI